MHPTISRSSPLRAEQEVARHSSIKSQLHHRPTNVTPDDILQSLAEECYDDSEYLYDKSPSESLVLSKILPDISTTNFDINHPPQIQQKILSKDDMSTGPSSQVETNEEKYSEGFTERDLLSDLKQGKPLIFGVRGFTSPTQDIIERFRGNRAVSNEENKVMKEKMKTMGHNENEIKEFLIAKRRNSVGALPCEIELFFEYKHGKVKEAEADPAKIYRKFTIEELKSFLAATEEIKETKESKK